MREQLTARAPFLTRKLWIRFLRVVHGWTGRRLQRHAVRRLVRHIEDVLHEEGKRARWN